MNGGELMEVAVEDFGFVGFVVAGEWICPREGELPVLVLIGCL